MNARKLQKLIDTAAKHGDAHFRAICALDEYCQEIYGTTPSDIDCDQILDAVYGASGSCASIPAERFDADMRESIERYAR